MDAKRTELEAKLEDCLKQASAETLARVKRLGRDWQRSRPEARIVTATPLRAWLPKYV